MSKEFDRLREIQGFILDFDGTTYLSNTALPGAIQFIELLEKQGKKHLWVTNNCYKTAEDYVAKLNSLGFAATAQDVFTSGMLAIDYLYDETPSPKVYPLAPRRYEQEMQSRGVRLTDNDPDFVVVSIDLELTYEKLKRACLLVRSGVPYIGTHPDLVWLTDEGALPDCGALLAAIEAATGVKPMVVLGKPHRLMAEAAVKRLGVTKDRAAVVGDRLYTDIKMGIDAGLVTILVLTGESKREDLEGAGVQPHFVLESVAELAELIS